MVRIQVALLGLLLLASSAQATVFETPTPASTVRTPTPTPGGGGGGPVQCVDVVACLSTPIPRIAQIGDCDGPTCFFNGNPDGTVMWFNDPPYSVSLGVDPGFLTSDRQIRLPNGSGTVAIGGTGGVSISDEGLITDSGDVASVGDCPSGTCFLPGSSGKELYFNSDGFWAHVVPGTLTASRDITIPDRSGTFAVGGTDNISVSSSGVISDNARIGTCTTASCFTGGDSEGLYLGCQAGSCTLLQGALASDNHDFIIPNMAGTAVGACTPPLVCPSGTISLTSSSSAFFSDLGSTALVAGTGNAGVMDDGRLQYRDGAAVLHSYVPVLNVLDEGAIPNDALGDSTALNTAIAKCSGRTLFVPKGTYIVDLALNLTTSNCTIQCEEPWTTWFDISAVTGSNGALATAATQNVTVKDCGWIQGTKQALNLTGGYNFRVTHNVFDMTGGRSTARGIGVIPAGVEGLVVEDSIFFGDADGGGQGITCSRDCNNIIIKNNRFEWLYNNVLVTSGSAGEEPSDNILIDGNTFIGGWPYARAMISNDGGAVTYSETTLNDSSGAVDFTTLTTNDTIRAMIPLLSSGAATTFSQNNKIVDAASNFVTAGILPGDIVETDTGRCAGGANSGMSCTQDLQCPSSTCDYLFAVVKEVEDADEMWLWDWWNKRTYRPSTTPATNTTFRVYQMVLGRRSSATASRVTLSGFRWFNRLGQRLVPPNGTRYDALWPHSNYCIQMDDARGVRHATITNNFLWGCWSDGISVGAVSSTGITESRVTNNTIVDDQDYCITINGAGVTVADNVLRHCGSGGMQVSGNDHLIHHNRVHNASWVDNTAATGITGINIGGASGGTRTIVDHNLVEQTGFCAGGVAQGDLCRLDADCAASTCTKQPLGTYGFRYTGVSDVTFSGNQTRGHATAGIRVLSTSTSVTLDKNSFPEGYELEWGSTYTVDDQTPRTLASLISTFPGALPASRFYCSTCDAETAPCSGTTGYGSAAVKQPTFLDCHGAPPVTTPTPSPTVTPVRTATPTATTTPTNTGPTPTRTLSPTRTATPSSTPTQTSTVPLTPTASPTPTTTVTPVG